MSQSNTEVYMQDWNEREDIASSMVPIITKLYRERGVVIRLFSHSLVKKDPVNIVKSHRFSRLIIDHELSVRETAPVLNAVAAMELCPCTVDIGRLYAKYEKTDKSMPIGVFCK